MKKQEKNVKKKTSNLFYKILSFILVIISVSSASVILYFEVLPQKYLIILFIILILIILGICYKLNTKTLLFTKIIMTIFSLIIICIESLGIIYSIGTIDFFNNIFDTGYRIETYNIYVLNDSTYTSLKELNNQNIIIYETESNTLKKAINKLKDKINFEKISVDSITSGVNSILEKESEAFLISESLISIYKDSHEEDYAKLKVLDTIDILTKSSGSFKIVDVRKKPFVVYLSGSDLTGSINKVSRSDVNLLAIVNPKKGKILLINTPRDYYVTLPTKKALDKLTHAGIYGIEESALTLGNLYDIDVNYYARVNFTSFVKIIDALNGIEVNSKYAFSYDGYTFKKGINKLDGKAALAFSRARKMLPDGDRSRGENQQAVIEGILKKVTNPSILTKYNTLLKSIESGVMTNVDQTVISKLVNLQIEENIKWKLESISVKGKDMMKPTYSTGTASVSVTIPNEEDINMALEKIKELID